MSSIHWTIVRMVSALAIILAVSFSIPQSFAEVFSINFLVPITFWSSISFIVYYTLLAPWWRSSIGHIIVALDSAIVAITFSELLKVEFGVVLPQNFQIRLASIFLLTASVTVISRIFLLGRINRWRPHLPWKHPRIKEEER